MVTLFGELRRLLERRWIPCTEGMPPWDESLRVLGFTAHDDFGGVQFHELKATDFYEVDDEGEMGTEVTRAVTHWMPTPCPTADEARPAQLSCLFMESGAAGAPVPDDDARWQWAWSVSARLAALPQIAVEQMPDVLTALIQEARELHPAMASTPARAAGKAACSGGGHRGPDQGHDVPWEAVVPTRAQTASER